MGDGAQYTEQIIFRLVDETSTGIDRIVSRAKAGTDNLKKLATEVAEHQRLAASRAAYEEHEIAKALHRYRMDANKDRIRAEREFQAVRQVALAEERAIHAMIMKMQQEERDARASNRAAAGGGGPTLGQGLRVGAGMLGATGNFQMAAGAYALERVADMAGVAGIRLAAVSGAAVAAGAALGGVALVIGAMVAGDRFTRELADMSTLLLDSSVSAMGFSKALDATAQSALNLSSTFNMDLVDVVKGFKDALSSGIEAADLERFGNASGQLSKALGVSFTQATNILTSFKDAYQLNISDLNKVNDVLFNTINYGKINAQELATNLGRVLPLAQQAGVSIEDLGSAIAALTRRGSTASQAVTSLADVINKLQNPAKGTAKLFDELGIAYGKAAIEGKHFSEIFANIVDKTGGNADLITKLFPDIRGKRGVASLIEGAKLLKDIEQDITKTGTATIAAQRAMDAYGVSFERGIKTGANAFAELGRTIGQAIGPFINHMVDSWQNYFDAFGEKRADKIWADGQRESLEKLAAAQRIILDNNAKILDAMDPYSKEREAEVTGRRQKDTDKKIELYSTDREKAKLKSLEEQIDSIKLRFDEAQLAADKMRHTEIESYSKILGIDKLRNSIADAKAGSAEMLEFTKELQVQMEKLKQHMAGWKGTAPALFGPEGIQLGGVSADLKAELARIQDDIKSRSARPQESTKESIEAFMNSIGLPTMAQLEAQNKKIDGYKESMKDRALELSKSFYEADQRAFQAFEDKKQKSIDKTLKRLDDARTRTEQILNRIRDESMDAQMRRHEGNPRKQREIAQGQFNSGVSELEGHLKTGNISQKVFESLLDMIDRASKAKESSMPSEDKERGARNRGSDLEVIKGLVDQFMKVTEAQASKDLAADKARKYNKLSQADAAKRGLAQAEGETKTAIKLDGKIDINFKNVLLATPEEKAAITKVILECFQTAMRKGDTWTPYTPEGR